MFITELTQKNVISINFGVIIISLYLKGFWQKKKNLRKKKITFATFTHQQVHQFLKDRI